MHTPSILPTLDNATSRLELRLMSGAAGAVGNFGSNENFEVVDSIDPNAHALRVTGGVFSYELVLVTDSTLSNGREFSVPGPNLLPHLGLPEGGRSFFVNGELLDEETARRVGGEHLADSVRLGYRQVLCGGKTYSCQRGDYLVDTATFQCVSVD